MFSTPAPQWTETKATAPFATRLVPVLDASGFWVLPDGYPPSGAFKADPGGSGFGIIDDTTVVGLKASLLPSAFVVTY